MKRARRRQTAFLALLSGFLGATIGGVRVRADDFVRSDSNADGALDISDAMSTLFFVIRGEPLQGHDCLDALDANDDGSLDLGDGIYTLRYLFLRGPVPPPPGLVCGPDPTGDALGCESFDLCAPQTEAPRASFTQSVDLGLAPLDVTFDASASVDADGRIERYEWDFGDGERSGGVIVTHTYEVRGSFTVTLTVTDDGGAQDEAQGLVTITDVRPTFITTTSPGEGEVGVAVTRETVIRFSRPVRTSSVTEQSIFASFGGEVLPGRLHTMPGRAAIERVTLFYTTPLPASSRIQVTVEGDLLKDEEGQPVDADGDGAPGGKALIEFDTLGLSLVPGTSVCGRVFASELGEMAGQSVDVPLEGVKITVDGAESTLFTFTDATGNFRLEPVPGGRFFVHIDGRAATNGVPEGAYYPFVGKAWESVPGDETPVGEVYLPLVAAGTLQPLNADSPTAITFAPSVLAEHPELAGVTAFVPPDNVYFDDGSRGGRVGIAPVPPDRLPGPLPAGVDPLLVFTMQTDGPTNFDAPVPVCMPNLPDATTGERLQAGEKAALVAFNHDRGKWEVVGSMTVSEDGEQICTDAGVGLLAPGWVFVDSTARVTNDAPVTSMPETREEGEHRTPYESKKDDANSPATCAFGCKIYLHNGEEHFSRVDLVIPGRGDIHFVMARSYRSQLDYNGPLGFGWDFSYNEGLFPKVGGDVVRSSGAGYMDRWNRQSDGRFAPPNGDFRRLVREPDGTLVLRAPNGFKRRYHPDGRLQAHVDRFGNTMIFEYDGRGNLDLVVDAYAREIDFVFESFPDGIDRLVKIRDFIGREVVYSYDARGDLVTVRSPLVTGVSTGNNFPEGRSERYAYSSGFAAPALNHNLLSVTYPEEVANGGPPAITWTYGQDPNDPETFDRVLEESLGGRRVNASGVPAGGTTLFVYTMRQGEEPLTTPDVVDAVGMATVIERNGRSFQYFVDSKNHHIETRRLTRPVDDAGQPRFVHRDDLPAELDYYSTRSIYDDDGQLLRRVFPEGNEVHYSYGSGGRAAQQNLIEIRRVAGPRGDGGAATGGEASPIEDIVMTFTYEPLYNQLASVTDPRGNSPGYVPPIGVTTAQRYTTRRFFDYQEGTQPIPDVARFGIDLGGFPRGLGDLNADGRTDQTAGNAVRTDGPTVELLADSNEAARRGSTRQPIVVETVWNDHGQPTRSVDPEGNVTLFRHYRENDPDGDGHATASVFKLLDSDDLSGYLASTTLDAGDSPRRTAASPPAVIEFTSKYDPAGNVIERRNPRGVTTRIEVNQLNERVVVTRGADVSGAVSSGQLLTGEEPFRFLFRRFFDHNGQVVRTETEDRAAFSTTEGVGQFIEETYTYDLLNNVLERTREVDARTRLTWSFCYDENELLIRITEPEGNEQEITYDERHLPFKTTRGLGSEEASTTRVHYDLNGNPDGLLDAEDNDGDGAPEASRFVYDGFDRRVITTDRLGGEFRCAYDPASNLVSCRFIGHPPGQPGGENTRLLEAAYIYDELDRVFQMDQELFLAEGFTPSQPVDLRDENSDGLVTSRMEYDALSRHTFFVEDDLQVCEVVYDGASRKVETIDAAGNRLLLRYDRNSNPVEVRTVEVSPEGLVPDETFTTIFVWDQLDRLVRVTDNAGQTVRFAYDSRNNLVFRADAQGPLMSDPLGLFPTTGGAGLPQEINAEGNTERYLYDGLDRRLEQVRDLREGGVGGTPLDLGNAVNPDGQVSLRFVWDGNSRLEAMIDDNGNRTEYRYDALNRQTHAVNADASTYAYTYDRDDNLTGIVHPNGSIVENTFDALNRLVRSDIDTTGAPSVIGTTAETYEYDGLSRVTRMTDDNGAPQAMQVSEMVYDSLSRLLEERQNGEAVRSVFSGDSKRLGCTYPGGRTIVHTHDAIDRITTTSDAGGPIAECSWIGPGYRELERICGNGTTLSFLNDGGDRDAGYDLVKRTVRMRCREPSGDVFLDREYGYNRASRRTFERRIDDSGLRDEYRYDSLYRVTSSLLDGDEIGGATVRDARTIDYLLDGVGNRREVSEETTSAGLVTTAYAINEVNEYVSRGGVTREYDDNGNLIADGTRRYQYDYKNRLVRVSHAGTGASIAEYFYHADNRRCRKVVFSESLPGVIERATNFFYDGWQVCEEQHGSSGATEATYVWSPAYIDGLVQMARGEEEFYLHQNARADVVSVTDGNGTVIDRRVYDDYGRAFGSAKQPVDSGPGGSPYGFQGRRLDPETGLYYFRNRYYEPESGRFLQRDPVWDPGNAGNQYTFGGNSPVSRIDPLGLDDEAEVGWQVRARERRLKRWMFEDRLRRAASRRETFNEFTLRKTGDLVGIVVGASERPLKVVGGVGLAAVGAATVEVPFISATCFILGAGLITEAITGEDSPHRNAAKVMLGPEQGEALVSGAEIAFGMAGGFFPRKVPHPQPGWQGVLDDVAGGNVRAQGMVARVQGYYARDLAAERPLWAQTVRRFEKCGVYSPEEAKYLLDNLDDYIKAHWDVGAVPSDVGRYGFVRPSPGVGLPRGKLSGFEKALEDPTFGYAELWAGKVAPPSSGATTAWFQGGAARVSAPVSSAASSGPLRGGSVGPPVAGYEDMVIDVSDILGK